MTNALPKLKKVHSLHVPPSIHFQFIDECSLESIPVKRGHTDPYSINHNHINYKKMIPERVFQEDEDRLKFEKSMKDKEDPIADHTNEAKTEYRNDTVEISRNEDQNQNLNDSSSDNNSKKSSPNAKIMIKSNKKTRAESFLASESSQNEDDIQDPEDKNIISLNPEECLRILNELLEKIFGKKTTINFSINTMKEYCQCKTENVLNVTPLSKERLERDGDREVKWNIFLQKDLREYMNYFTNLYTKLELMTNHLDNPPLDEIFVIITQDKISFDKAKLSLETEEKSTGEIRLLRKKCPGFGVFLLYMASYQIPDALESLGDELDLTARLAKYE